MSFPGLKLRPKKVHDRTAPSCRGARDDMERAEVAEVAKSYLKSRRARERLFPAALFGEAAWDILLDLYVSRVEGRAVTVSDATVASGVAATTGLRWIGKLLEEELIVRFDDPHDKRRSFLEIRDDISQRVEQWIIGTFPDRFESNVASFADNTGNDRVHCRTP